MSTEEILNRYCKLLQMLEEDAVKVEASLQADLLELYRCRLKMECTDIENNIRSLNKHA